MDRLIDNLRDLGNIVSKSIDNVSSGGCCVYAAIVAPYINKITPVRIRVGNPIYDEDVPTTTNISLARQYVEDPSNIFAWNSEGIEFGHVFIEFKHPTKSLMYAHDNNFTERMRDVDPTFEYKIVDGELSLQEARALAQSARGWNRCFRRKQIPKMEQIIKRFFDNNTSKMMPS